MTPDPLHADEDCALGIEPNVVVVEFLKARGSRRADGRYQEHTHPDLIDLLRSSGEGLGARLVYFYGFPSLVSANCIVFAYAQGTSSLVFRVPEGGFSRDLPRGDPEVEVPDGWVQTYAWLGSRPDWTVREGDAAIDERFIAAATAAEG